MTFRKLKTLEFAEWDDVRDHMRAHVGENADVTFMLLLKGAGYSGAPGLRPIFTKDLEAEAWSDHEERVAKFFREEFGDKLWIYFQFTLIDTETYAILQGDD